MKSKSLKIMLIIASIILALVISVLLFTQQKKFGKLPEGERLERIKLSPQFKDGIFHNNSHTPTMSEDAKLFSTIKEFLFAKNKRPSELIPSIKIDLLNLSPEKNILVWFGHSSYFMQVDGKKILVDPVLSGSASPVYFTTKAFKGSDAYTTDDLPQIDYLFITHDHWDHLDYETVMALKPKINKIITGLGSGAHFEYWGFDKERIIEEDWHTEIKLDAGFSVNTTPGRHFSGRGFKANRALWMSFVFQTPSLKIFIGGDSGYDTHFAAIGEKFGPFDLAILENGQYNTAWKYIHLMPSQTLQAAKDLKAKRLMPVHSSKFALANHAWDTPLKTITTENTALGIPLVTPIIGEMVNLNDSTQQFSKWWEDIK